MTMNVIRKYFLLCRTKSIEWKLSDMKNFIKKVILVRKDYVKRIIYRKNMYCTEKRSFVN